MRTSNLRYYDIESRTEGGDDNVHAQCLIHVKPLLGFGVASRVRNKLLGYEE